MTAIFGICSERKDIQSLVVDHYRSVWGQLSTERVDNWLVGSHAEPSNTSLYRSGSLVLGVDGEPSSQALLSQIDISGVTHGMIARETGGNCFILNTEDECIRLECHESGYLPLYWAFGERQFIFGSSLCSFMKLGWNSISPVGATSFLRHGYCLNDSTLLAGVNRLRPGQVLTWDGRAKQDDPRLEDRSRLWVQQQGLTRQFADNGESAEYIWSQIRRAVKRTASESEPPAIMLSGGWDSRTLLAALLDCSVRPVCYVHGDIESRELSLVRRIAGDAGLEIVAERIDDRCLDLDWLLRRFPRTENLVFPHWHRASEVLGSRGITEIVSGIFGEVLGGHYGPSMHLSGAAKIASVARELLSRHGNERTLRTEADVAPLAGLLEPEFSELPYYLKSSEWEDPEVVSSELSQAARAVLSGYRSRGTSTIEGLVEAFSTEHRGAQYIAAQPLSFRASAFGIQPFAESELIMTASNLPLGLKIHNKLNRQILLKFASSLTTYSMAATLVPASAPIAIQESSRLARRLLVSAQERISAIQPHSKQRNWRLSWVNFDFLRNSSSVDSLIEDLRQPFWDRDALHAKARFMADGTRGVSPHHLYDQLMKIYTVDSLLRRGTTLSV